MNFVGCLFYLLSRINGIFVYVSKMKLTERHLTSYNFIFKYCLSISNYWANKEFRRKLKCLCRAHKANLKHKKFKKKNKCKGGEIDVDDLVIK